MTTIDTERLELRAHVLPLAGGDVYVEDWGDREGRVILALHTAGQNGVQYATAAPALADRGYRVLVPDLPGHGRSAPYIDGPVTDLGIYAQVGLDVLDVLGADVGDRSSRGAGRSPSAPIVLGCSIGGKIALDICTRADDRLGAVVAMAAGLGPGSVKVSALRRDLVDMATPSRSEQTYLGTRAVVGSAVAEHLREHIAVMHRREDPEVSTSDLLGWAAHDIRERAEALTAPALPAARFALVEGIGHYPMEEMPDFAVTVDGWIKEMVR